MSDSKNVVGFESSECAVQWRSALASAGYCTPMEWHLTPTMIGVPNERPRYYGLARRLLIKSSETVDTHQLPSHYEIISSWPGKAAEAAAVALQHVDGYLELPAALDGSEEPEWLTPWLVPSALMEKDSSWCFDIVAPVLQSSKEKIVLPQVRATACFTHSYGRFVRGTGSVLYVPPSIAAEEAAAEGPDSRLEPESREFGQCWKELLHSGGGKLRYFTPREVANFLGFPRSHENTNTTNSFRLPAELSTTRAWAALGNSIHIGTAAAVLKYGLQEMLS